MARRAVRAGELVRCRVHGAAPRRGPLARGQRGAARARGRTREARTEAAAPARPRTSPRTACPKGTRRRGGAAPRAPGQRTSRRQRGEHPETRTCPASVDLRQCELVDQRQQDEHGRKPEAGGGEAKVRMTGLREQMRALMVTWLDEPIREAVRELRADNRKREGQRPKDYPSSHRTEWYADPRAPDSRLASPGRRHRRA